MARPAPVISEPDLELALLRKGVGALTAGRHECVECGRTPLVGERVYTYRRAATVCALCRPLRRGEPEGSELVLHSEVGLSVRRLRVA
jgi:hypothetical protein